MNQKSPSRSSKKPTSRERFRGLHNHPYVVPVITFLVLFFVSLFGYISLNGQTIGASDSRVVALTIDGKEQIVPTRAVNVEDLLKRLKITLGEEDIVNPALDTPIVEDGFQVTIYRARPVQIEDGASKKVIFTAQPTPEAIVQTAGVNVYPEDKLVVAGTTNVQTDDLLKQGIVAEKVVVKRAKTITLNLYFCNAQQVRTQANTTEELLTEKNIKLNATDTLRPGADEKIVNGSEVFVGQQGTDIVCEEQIVPAPVETREDPNLLVGNTTVIQEGSDGRKIVTYELEMQDGVEIGRRVSQEVVVSVTVPRIVAKGTKVVFSNPSANVELGRQIADQLGWGNQFNCIYTIFDRESKWNHLARNRSSGAYGIPQALPGSKMGPGWETDPAVQIRWGINYMVNRYGSPCQANAFWQVNHWY